MKFFIKLIFFILFVSNSYKVYAEESLTIKQQLDRIMEEVKDLNKAVFNKSFEKKDTITNDDSDKFTSIDIRIYDLEKDIKNLTLQFEEILFKIEDLSNEINSLENNLTVKFEELKIKSQAENIENINNSNKENLVVKEKNTLGKLVITDDSTQSDINENQIEQSQSTIDQKNNEEISNLSAEEQLQFALDQMMKKKYDNSKKVLEEIIINFPDNQLVGSAHFWLGKIYLFESNYRKAAIVFGEGVQKFPKSIKAPEMYYELSKSLKEMNKIPEACKTLTLLEDNYKGNKFTKDPENIKEKLNCEVQN